MQPRNESFPPELLQESFTICMERLPETKTEAIEHLAHCLWCLGWVEGYIKAQLKKRARYTNLMLEEWRAGGCDADGYLAGGSPNK